MSFCQPRYDQARARESVDISVGGKADNPGIYSYNGHAEVRHVGVRLTDKPGYFIIAQGDCPRTDVDAISRQWNGGKS